MTPTEFLCWLIHNKPATIIFEACGTSNYWRQKAIESGHDARLISAKLVSVVRQNQKTGKNDAEGVGTMNAINLYIAPGCWDIGVFTKGKDASACIGLTPIQHSSGGLVKLGSIGKHCKNSILRS